MGLMYKEICYEDSTFTAQAIASNLTWTNIPIIDVTSLNATQLEIHYGGGPWGDNYATVTLPACEFAGLSNFLGVELEDAVTTSWLVALTLITAWSIVVLRRTF